MPLNPTNPTSLLPLNPAYRLLDEPVLWLLALSTLTALGLFFYHLVRCAKLDSEFDVDDSMKAYYNGKRLRKHALLAGVSAGMVVVFWQDAVFDRSRPQLLDITWSLRTSAVLTTIAAVLSFGALIRCMWRTRTKVVFDFGALICALSTLICTLAATDLFWVWSKPYAIHALRPWFDIENTLFWVIEVVLAWTLIGVGASLARSIRRRRAVHNNLWVRAANR